MVGFYNEARARQLLDFSQLKYGRCSFTDIDMSMDWQGRTFVFCELKQKGNGLTTGQRIHLEGLVTAIEETGRRAYAILASHDTKVEDIVDAGSALVVRWFTEGQWTTTSDVITLDELVHTFYVNHQRMPQHD